MIATLIERNNSYVCSECMMRQKCLECTCWFCGRLFDNFEQVALKEFEKENESNILGANRESYGMEQ